MIWAILDNQRIEATPKQKALCPLCNQEVISKCGSIKIWHWAHKQQEECDSFGEPESEWHLSWKNQFPKECQEVTIEKCISEYCYNSHETTGQDGHAPCNHINCNDCEFVIHRTDVKTEEGIIIEFQNSPLSFEKIEERETFYDNMIWVLNGNELCRGLILRKKKSKIIADPKDEGAFYDYENKCYSKYTGKEFISFRWKSPPKSWWVAKKLIYVDFGDFLFLIKKLYPNIPCGGWGVVLSKKEFLDKFIKNKPIFQENIFEKQSEL